MSAQQLSNVGIGGSEIAAACGFSRYRSRFGLWLEKTGRAPAFAGNIHTRLGQLCEPRARQLYADATGEDVEIPPCSVFHPEIPWARCTPDGRWVSDRRVKVQIKCVGHFVGARWRYEIPVEVEAQCQWEMLVDDGDRNDLAVLVGTDEIAWERFVLGALTDPAQVFSSMTLDVHTLWRSDGDIQRLRDGALAFMQLVWSDTQPPIDDSDECAAFLNGKARKCAAAIPHDIDEDTAAAVAAFRAGYIGDRDAKTALDLAKNLTRAAMATHGANRIDTPDGPVLWTVDRNGKTSLRAPLAWGKPQEH